jgi:hypothetical protein
MALKQIQQKIQNHSNVRVVLRRATIRGVYWERSAQRMLVLHSNEQQPHPGQMLLADVVTATLRHHATRELEFK